jgi:hypothetical protein
VDDAPNDTSKGYKVDGFKVRTEDNVQLYVLSRDIREGWPLLTVETEVNRDSKSTNERGPSLIGSLDSLCRYNRFLYRLGCAVQNIIFLIAHFFISPHRPATWEGRRSGSPVPVSVKFQRSIGLLFANKCALSARQSISNAFCLSVNAIAKARAVTWGNIKRKKKGLSVQGQIGFITSMSENFCGSCNRLRLTGREGHTKWATKVLYH